MNIVLLLIGIAVVLFSIISVFVCISRTPNNLRGFYGLMFWIIAISGIVGGVTLIVSAL